MTPDEAAEMAARMADAAAENWKRTGDLAQGNPSRRFVGTVEQVNRLLQHELEKLAKAIRAATFIERSPA